jgi:hypothetical protein
MTLSKIFIGNMRLFIILCSVSLLLTSRTSLAQLPLDKLVSGRPLGLDEDVAGRARFEQMRLANPATGLIPQGMRAKELKFVAGLPSREDAVASSRGKFSTLSVPSVDWEPRGPENIGGRTDALGIDFANENIINAGGVAGGMWHSTDGGSTWVRTTPLDQIDNISALAQDIRKGKTSTWYCSTGEPVDCSIGGPVGGGEFIGNGIFKSTDDGVTWNILPATVSTDSAAFTSPFNWVCQIAIDSSNANQDIVYAATIGGIERSSDGGQTWTMTLGSFTNGSGATDVAVSSTGVVYAVLSEDQTLINGYAPLYGAFRSTDGIHWTNITPPTWERQTYYIYLGMAPSNGNVIYFSAVDANRIDFSFWKYTYLSGDGSDSGGMWEDRTSVLTAAGIEVPWDGDIHVQPNNENIVYLGSVELWRSTDGFATVDHVSNLSINNGQYDLHADQQAIAFYPSNPNSMIVGCDGGLLYTPDNQADQVSWTSLDNNYLTMQFYTIGIDHYTPGSVTVLGGSQDNGSALTLLDDETQPWSFAGGGDGQACAIAGDQGLYFASSQIGYTFAESFDGNGTLTGYKRIDPTGGSGYPWQNPFALDPNNSDMMYFGGGRILWRNNDLSSIPLSQYYDTSTTTIGWDSLSATRLPVNGPYGAYSTISAIGVSTNPPNRVYYGTDDGMLFRLDGADTGNDKPKAIWAGKGFPQYGFISSIAVNPNNADTVIVCFANFEVQSLFLTTNGGTTWKPIGGNLEEYPDGSGNGPSCRSIAILPLSDGMIYLVGTSTGVYSTNKLNGMSTVWSLEGASTIGNDIIDAIDVRPSDGYVAVGSCGSGAFTATFTSANSAVKTAQPPPSQLTLEPNYPNPYNSITHFQFKLPNSGNVSLEVYDEGGVLVASIISEAMNAGTYTTEWNSSNIPSGVYVCKLSENGQSVSRLVSIER